MAKVTYKNENNGDVVTLDSDHQDAKRLAKLDNWKKVATPAESEGVDPDDASKGTPAKSASRETWLEYARRHASDAEQAALEVMTRDQLAEQYGAGKAVGV